jgi:hypothetical protein
MNEQHVELAHPSTATPAQPRAVAIRVGGYVEPPVSARCALLNGGAAP